MYVPSVAHVHQFALVLCLYLLLAREGKKITQFRRNQMRNTLKQDDFLMRHVFCLHSFVSFARIRGRIRGRGTLVGCRNMVAFFSKGTEKHVDYLQKMRKIMKILFNGW